MSDRVLVYRAGSLLHALPLAHVIEIMRPLPIEPLKGSFAFVRGLALIRGAPTPVVDLAELAGQATSSPAYFVTVRAAQRRVAILADAVLGVRSLPPAARCALPPLLGGDNADLVTSIGALDAELLLVLRDAHVVPDQAWTAIDDPEMAA